MSLRVLAKAVENVLCDTLTPAMRSQLETCGGMLRNARAGAQTS